VLFISRDMSRAVAVLVVACPGAFVLAGPTAMIAALAAASRLGILIKNTKFLEVLADVDTVVLDKTGTVTLGHLEVVTSRPWARPPKRNSCARRHFVPRALGTLSPEPWCELPLRPGSCRPSLSSRLKSKPGKGVVAGAGGHRYSLGRGDWLSERGMVVPEGPEHAGAVVWVARDEVVLGCLLLADLPRPEARAAVNELRELGLTRVVLLTGDRRHVAAQVAKTLDIEHVVAEVLPEQKLETVQAEKACRPIGHGCGRRSQ